VPDRRARDAVCVAWPHVSAARSVRQCPTRRKRILSRFPVPETRPVFRAERGEWRREIGDCPELAPIARRPPSVVKRIGDCPFLFLPDQTRPDRDVPKLIPGPSAPPVLP